MNNSELPLSVRGSSKLVMEAITQMMDKLSETECSRIVYVPIVVENLAFAYAIRFCDIAAEERQPLKKECREIRELYRTWQKRNENDLCPSTKDMVRRKTEEFFTDTAYDTQRLYWAINFQLKKKYACLPDVQYRLLTEAICFIVLSNYVMKFKRASDIYLAKQMNLKPIDTADPEFVRVVAIMFQYCGDYNLRNNQMVKTGLQIIAKWANALKFNG